MRQLQKVDISEGADFFNDFFRKLKICCPSWRSQLKTNKEHAMFKQQWITAFAENGVDDPRKLEIGLAVARRETSSWLPSSGQFIAWCMPTAESLGLPNVREAYREAAFHQPQQAWSCSLVYFSQLAIQYELKTLSEARSYKIFERMYEVVLQRILDGEELSAPPKPLPSPKQVSQKDDPKKISSLIDEIYRERGWTRGFQK